MRLKHPVAIALACATSAVIIGLFASTLLGVDRIGFRDVSHFYTPLYQYVGRRQASQWLPLWNPLDQTGLPLIGETTTAFFYPVRYAIYCLRLPAATAIAWYVAIHMVLAFLFASVAATWTGLRWRSGSFVGLAYALSGSVFFLHTNPPYLVSAAWMPLALFGVLSSPVQCPVRRRRRAIASIALAMMVLGGDPQTALHVMIVVTVILVARWMFRRQTFRASAASGQLLIVPLLAAVLAAPQIAASLSWASQSKRVAAPNAEPRFSPPIRGSDRFEAYEYSLAPWHAAELFTPNAFGSLFPFYRRVASAIPGDGRVWTPTIYLGLLAAIAWVDRLIQLRKRRIDAALAIALIGLAMSCGQFGLVWWIQNATGTLGGYDSAAFGPYWFLHEFLPGYDAFRYPAKWLPFFSIGIALVLGQWVEGRRWRVGWMPIAIVAVVVGTGLLAASVLRSVPSLVWDPQRGLPRDEFWGPLDIDGGLAEIQSSLAGTMACLVAIAMLLRFAKTRHWSAGHVAVALFVVSLLDLGFSAGALVTRVPIASEQELIDSVAQTSQPDSIRWMRTRQGIGWPTSWQSTSSRGRILEVEASQRLAGFGRWHLSGGDRFSHAAVFNNMVSIEAQAMADFWSQARSDTANLSETEQANYWQNARRRLGISGLIHASDAAVKIIKDGQELQMIDVKRIALPVHLAADRLEVQASGDKPFSLTRPVYQDGHWIATYRAAGGGRWKSLDVERGSSDAIGRLGQRVELPAGNWTVRFRYSPAWVGWTLPVAALGWFTLLAFWIRQHVPARSNGVWFRAHLGR